MGLSPLPRRLTQKTVQGRIPQAITRPVARQARSATPSRLASIGLDRRAPPPYPPCPACHLRASSRNPRVSEVLQLTDIHCHILPGIDDGAADWEESLAMARLAAEDGMPAVVATPHQLGIHGRNLGPEIRRRTAQLQERLREAGIGLAVLPGAEIRVEPDLWSKLASGELLSLADRQRHVLLGASAGGMPAVGGHVGQAPQDWADSHSGPPRAERGTAGTTRGRALAGPGRLPGADYGGQPAGGLRSGPNALPAG